MLKRTCFALFAALSASSAFAAPYASTFSVTGGTNVSFVLNEPADVLTYSINGGAPITLDGSTAGVKSFSLGSPSDTYSVNAKKLSATGYSVPTGGIIPTGTNGLSQPTAASGLNQINSDSNNTSKYNSPRGVTVNVNPNSTYFGTTYITNSAAGSSGGRTLTGDGFYAVRADFADRFGYGDAAKDGGLTFAGSANSPYRITIGPDNNMYLADFSDANGQISRLSPDLSSGSLVLVGLGGPTALPAGQNHGSTHAVAVTTGTGGGIKVFTVDEDLTTSFVTGSGSTTDHNSIWKYDIGNSALPYSTMPTKVGNVSLVTGITFADLERGPDGKLYAVQDRGAGAEPGITVLDESGTVLYDSLTASRTLLANPTANDIITNANAVAISPDDKFLALMLNFSDVAVIPLVNGIPDLSRRLVVDAGNVNSGRDIAFDAADNIHYVSSGQALYRALSPGGFSDATTSFDGTNYAFAFNQLVPEPASMALIALGATSLLGRRRRA